MLKRLGMAMRLREYAIHADAYLRIKIGQKWAKILFFLLFDAIDSHHTHLMRIGKSGAYPSLLAMPTKGS